MGNNAELKTAWKKDRGKTKGEEKLVQAANTQFLPSEIVSRNLATTIGALY